MQRNAQLMCTEVHIIWSVTLIRMETVKAHSHSDEKHLSALLYLSTCINTAPTGQISVKFYMEDFYKNLSRKC